MLPDRRNRLRDVARLAMLDQLTGGNVLAGSAVRRAFAGLDSAMQAVFAILDKEDAAVRRSMLAEDHVEMMQIVQAAQQEAENA